MVKVVEHVTLMKLVHETGLISDSEADLKTSSNIKMLTLNVVFSSITAKYFNENM